MVREERERAPAPGSCCLSGRPGLLPASPRPLTATLKGRYSQPRVTRGGESGAAGSSDQSKAGPPGLLGGRARPEALAKLTPAVPPPRSPVQGAQWVRPALPYALYRAASLAEAHLCEEGRCRHVRDCTKLIEHLRCTSKCEPGNRYRPAASLALPRGSWALKSLLYCPLESVSSSQVRGAPSRRPRTLQPTVQLPTRAPSHAPHVEFL